jgi:hypothetical protein
MEALQTSALLGGLVQERIDTIIRDMNAIFPQADQYINGALCTNTKGCSVPGACRSQNTLTALGRIRRRQAEYELGRPLTILEHHL